MTRKLAKALGITLVIGALTGCAGHYRIRDTANTDTAYYATRYDRAENGAVSFKDARTEAKVTLQSSSVESISKKEWEKAVKN